VAVREKKGEIIPIRAGLSALKIFKNHQQARFGSGINVACKRTLLGAPNSDRFNVPVISSTYTSFGSCSI